ncbi:MAG: hypothetical protein HZB16_00420 [Armatimonadetes bacterium]|nr:hypothetical protein [Armatimonadota bacterium]
MGRKLRPLAGILAVVLVQQFLWGKLFAWSPVIVGFERLPHRRAVVYRQPGAVWPADLDIDALVAQVERWHGLTFRHKPQIVAFGGDASYLRHVPTRARFCAFPSGRLVVSPWALREAAAGRILLSTYLRHELSHLLLFDHGGPLTPWRFPKWLLEGIAVTSAEQQGTPFYPSREATRALIRAGNWVPPTQFKTRAEDAIVLRVPYRQPFIYCQNACLVDDLISRVGRERFLGYVRDLLRARDREQAFKACFGESFTAFSAGFRARLACDRTASTAPP